MLTCHSSVSALLDKLLPKSVSPGDRAKGTKELCSLQCYETKASMRRSRKPPSWDGMMMIMAGHLISSLVPLCVLCTEGVFPGVLENCLGYPSSEAASEGYE